MKGVRILKDGKTTLEITDRLTRILGEFFIVPGENSGVEYVTFPTGTPFVIIDNGEMGYRYSNILLVRKSTVSATINSNSIIWNRSLVGAGNPEFPIKVTYGVY